MSIDGEEIQYVELAHVIVHGFKNIGYNVLVSHVQTCSNCPITRRQLVGQPSFR